MKFKKPDEMEKYQNEKSAGHAFIFYCLALLVWSLFDFFSKGVMGVQFIILSIGNVIFFGSRLIYNMKMK